MKVTKESSAMGPTHQKNRTLGLFNTICKIIYISCATNFYYEDLNYPKVFMKIYEAVSKILEVVVFVFVLMEFGSFYTQRHLTEKQQNDVFLFALSHSTIYIVYASALYYKNELRELVRILGVELKEVCNDEKIEKMMVKSAGRYLSCLGFVCSSTLFSYGIDGARQSITTAVTTHTIVNTNGGLRRLVPSVVVRVGGNLYTPFITVIPMWPDVEDQRVIAGVARVLHYFIWWIFVVRVVSIYLIVLTITICLAHQFTNLCKYFENLNSIFEGSGSQADKEKRYEDAFKVGIDMHCTTLWCIRQTQMAGSVAFTGQGVINLAVLVLLMMQMMNTERSLVAVMPIFFMGCSVLGASGVFMWNAGDVTIEASELPSAMFYSGWYNCQRETSVRVRKMVAISMIQAQQPVSIKGFGFIELSYESYVTIVKSSYSLFSVIY